MSTVDDTTFGAEIKKAIELAGLTYAKVARKMGISRQAVNRLDQRKTFNLDFLQKLKDATGLDYTHYVFNPKKAKYEPLQEVSVVSDPVGQYHLTKTLTFSIQVKNDKLDRFGEFLSEMEAVAGKYEFVIV